MCVSCAWALQSDYKLWLYCGEEIRNVNSLYAILLYSCHSSAALFALKYKGCLPDLPGALSCLCSVAKRTFKLIVSDSQINSNAFCKRLKKNLFSIIKLI